MSNILNETILKTWLKCGYSVIVLISLSPLFSSCIFQNPESPNIHIELVSVSRREAIVRVNIDADRTKDIFKIGGCVSTEPQPTIENGYFELAGGNHFNTTVSITPGKVNHIRMFVLGGAGLTYSNEIEVPAVIDDSGSEWISYVMDEPYHLNEVILANGKVMVAGDHNIVLANWMQQPLNVSISLKGIVWSGSQFIAVGHSGILRSSNGKDWISISIQSEIFQEPRFYGVSWSGNRFVAVGYRMVDAYKTAIYYSDDGVNWFESDFKISLGMLRSIIWAGDKFIAVGTKENNPLIISSSDGINWTEQTLDYPGYKLYDIIWTGTKFIAVGNATYYEMSGPPVGSNSIVASSINGLSWNTKIIDQANFFSITHGIDTYVAVGDGIYTSRDATNWEKKNIYGYYTRMTSVMWTGEEYYCVGQGMISYYRSDY